MAGRPQRGARSVIRRNSKFWDYIRTMRGKSYTFFIASNASGGMRRVAVPFYLLHVVVALALVGGLR